MHETVTGEDVRRMRLARKAVGPDTRIAVDADQRWTVGDALTWLAGLARTTSSSTGRSPSWHW
jgi:L-alanine-DL-glutamate epimerase-like enolase superfamily enzyme